MSLQYLSDETGHVIAVQLPIEEWEQLKSKYPDLEAPAYVIPSWHKELIDSRLQAINENPDCVLPIDSLIEELGREVE